MAAVQAILIQNRDERGRNPYMQTLSCYSASVAQCNSFFPAVPAGKRLVIEHVNVSVDTPMPLREYFRQ
jgi:hypothetical protein